MASTLLLLYRGLLPRAHHGSREEDLCMNLDVISDSSTNILL